MSALAAGDMGQHPMWETQVRLEYGMRKYGEDAAESRRAKAEERGQMTRLRPVRGLVAEWLPKVTKQLVDWLDACKRSRGVTPIASNYLRSRPESHRERKGAEKASGTEILTCRFDDIRGPAP